MKMIYCIPGLGADEAIFSRLHPQRAELKPFRLPRPSPDESISAYALRLTEKLDSGQPSWILGHSFGGILALEMAQHRPTERIILVSSVTARSQLPWYGRGIGACRLHRLAPLSRPGLTLPVSAWLNGIESKKDRALLDSMVIHRDVPLLTWSLDQVLRWRGCPVPEGIVHIHGTADRLLPARWVHPDYWIEGGTHFMIVTRVDEISALLDRLVADCD